MIKINCMNAQSKIATIVISIVTACSKCYDGFAI